MAASASDKARKSYSYLQKTLNGAIDDNDTVLTPNNVTNIPTDTGVSFVIDRVSTSGALTPTLRELMTGVVSGGTLTGLVRGEQGTTAQSHANGAVIEFVNSGEMWNDLIDFMLTDHSNPNGNHKTLTDDNGNEWLERGSVASAVNQVKVTNSITGAKPEISASGGDTNIGLSLVGKGTGRVETDGLPPQTFVDEATTDFIASGGIVAQTVTLTGSFSNMVHYVGGKRYTKTSVANKLYTASKDTYVDAASSSDATVVYTEVANGAAAPALTAGSIRIAKVVTDGTTITSVVQYGADSLGNIIAPVTPITDRQVGATVAFKAYRTASQTLTTSTITKLQFTLEDYDLGLNWDSATNYQFTAPVAGIYHFEGQLAIDATGSQCLSYIYVNGVKQAEDNNYNNAATDDMCSRVSATLLLNAGDTVDYRGHHNAGADRALLSSKSATYFSGFLVGQI